MTEDRIELVDRDYGQSIRVNPSRQIKTRSVSFRNIRERYNKFRLKYLERKLEKKIESALTQGYTEENFDRKITKNANIIAKIEEKIMLLNKEDVPTDYVAKRAIKLRKNMISNLTYNTGVMYTVGLENRDAVFGNEENEVNSEVAQAIDPSNDDLFTVKEDQEEVSAPVNDAMLAAAIPADTSSDEIDVVPSDLERQEIVDVVNSSFDGMKENEGTDSIGTEEVREVVDDALNRVDAPNDELQVNDGASEVDREAVRGVIEDAFEAMEKDESETSERVTVDEPIPVTEATNTYTPEVHEEGPVQEAMPVEQTAHVTETPMEVTTEAHEEVPVEATPEVHEEAPVVSDAEQADIHEQVEKEIEKIRVSRNNSTAANVSQYDEDGYRRERRKKYNYTPMTDEEIRQSQIKLGFDEHGNLIDNGARPKETISSARIAGSFVAPGSIPNISLDDVFVPAEKQARDVPVVVPDRDDSSLGLDLDDDKSLFEIIEQPTDNKEEAETPVVAQEESRTVEDFNELKKKLLFLQQQKQLTQQQKMDAQRSAQEAAQQAQEARRLYEVSQANYNERMEKLRAYTASLEADCSENVRGREQAEDEARRNNSFAQEQRELADNNSRIIGEIDSMIGSDETTTAIRVR